jgi:hypothetical protein
LQLVVSRRHPKLIGAANVSPSYPTHETDDCWGFTVVRREDATTTSKIPVLTYLAPLGAKAKPRNGGVLRFRAPTMPLFPKGDVAYKRPVESGTLMKLYAYQLKNTGNIIRRDGLLYKLDLLLPDPALPIRMHECRKRAHGQRPLRPAAEERQPRRRPAHQHADHDPGATAHCARLRV